MKVSFCSLFVMEKADTPHQEKVLQSLRKSLEKQRATLPDQGDVSAVARDVLDYETTVRLELIDVQREALTALRDSGQIDGAIYLRLESLLDSDEKNLRLTRDARSGELRGPE